MTEKTIPRYTIDIGTAEFGSGDEPALITALADTGSWVRYEDHLAALTSERSQREAAERERDAAKQERWFPIQRSHRSTTPHPMRVPWSVAEKAYSTYARRYGKGQTLERLAERGGFCPGEMDDLHPAWRDETSEIVSLRAERDSLTAALAEKTRERDYWRNELVRLDTGLMETLEGDWSTDDGEGQPPEKVVDHLFSVIDGFVDHAADRIRVAESQATAAREALKELQAMSDSADYGYTLERVVEKLSAALVARP